MYLMNTQALRVGYGTHLNCSKCKRNHYKKYCFCSISWIRQISADATYLSFCDIFVTFTRIFISSLRTFFDKIDCTIPVHCLLLI